MTKENSTSLDINIGYPRFCDIVIATQCMLRCKMCKAWQGGAHSNAISFEIAKKFVQSLSEFVKFPLEINVMGGEPLLKDWCLDLCSFISEKGFKSIISTNAYLIDEAMARKIADSKLSVLAVSLESLNPHSHDFYRGIEGTFEKVMNAIKYIDTYCRGRLAITILTIIMEKNLDEIIELVEWVNDNDLFVNISFLALLETGLVHPRENWFLRPEYAQIWPQDIRKVHRLIDDLIRLKKRGYKIWNPVSQLDAFKEYYVDPDKFMRETEYRIHDYIVDLDENGTAYLSGEPLGNIKENTVKELWFSKKANQIRRQIDRHGPGKRCCVINFVCAFPEDSEYKQKQLGQYMQGHQDSRFRYLEQRQIDKAINEFKEALMQDPFNEHIHQGLGACYQHKKELAKAIEEFAQALKINQNNEHAHQGLGFCYKDLKKFDIALYEFKRVLEINPKNAHGFLGFGFCYLEQGQIDKAFEAFNQALKLDPHNEHAHQGLGSCYQDGKDFPAAIDEFRKVLLINSNNEYAHQGLAYCYESLKEFNKAIDEFTQALKINPDNEEYHQGLGRCYEGLRQFDKAINEFRHVLKTNPGNKYASGCIKSCEEGLNRQNNIKVRPNVQEVSQYTRDVGRPDFCVIEVSHRCILQCKMCNYWKIKDDKNEITIQDLYTFISSLKKFITLPFEMNISGGEPLLKEGVLDFIEFIAQEGFRFSLVTNGYLIDKTIAKRIADSGLSFLAISLDSLDADTHDYLRGVKGAHKKATEALEYFAAYRGILKNVVIQTIIMGQNMDGIVDLVKWAQDKQLSISFMAITRPNMIPMDTNWYRKEEFSFLWPKDISKVQRTLDTLIKLKNTGYRIDNPTGQLERFKLYFSDPKRFVRETPCSLGEDIIHINPHGDIHVCCEMEPLGNIDNGDISHLWTSEKAKLIREKIRLCKKNCAEMVNCYRGKG